MSDARWAAVLFAVAVLARGLACFGSALFGTDSGHYLLMADWMRAGLFDQALAVAYHPLYPLLIAALRSVLGSTEHAGNLVSILLGSAAVLPLFWTVRDVFGRPTAVLTALLYCFSPALVDVQSDVMTEGTFLFFLFASQWLTWRAMEKPSLERGAVLGAAAAAAFLTRPEGLLAIALALGWPLLVLLRKRDAIGIRLASLGLSVAVVVLLASPYLLWVKQHRGRWALSPRPSAGSVEREMGVKSATGADPEAPPPSHYYGLFAKSVYRLTMYGTWIPFMIVGLATLRRPGAGRWFYFSLPLAHLGAVLYTLRAHPFMSDRYILAPMALLGVLTASGLAATLRALARRRPEAAWRPLASGVLILVVIVLPIIKCFHWRRQECRSYPMAAAKILEQGKPRAMSGPVEQVAYLCGVRSYYGASTHEGIRAQIVENGIDYFVYTEKDVTGRRDWVEMIQTCPYLMAPVEVVGPPGTWKVFYQRSK